MIIVKVEVIAIGPLVFFVGMNCNIHRGMEQKPAGVR